MKVGVICMKVKVKIHRFIRPEQRESLKVKKGLKEKGGVQVCLKVKFKIHKFIRHEQKEMGERGSENMYESGNQEP